MTRGFDYDGDGRTDPVLISDNGRILRVLSSSACNDPEIKIPDGRRVFSADFDGNGKDEIVSYNEETGEMDIHLATRREQRAFEKLDLDATEDFVVLDYDGDGADEVAVWDAQTSEVTIKDGCRRITLQEPVENSPLKIPLDTDGNGDDEILVLYPWDGSNPEPGPRKPGVLLFADQEQPEFTDFIPSYDSVFDYADFNGDGKYEMVDFSGPQISVPELDATLPLDEGFNIPLWSITDLDGNGKEELFLLRGSSDGTPQFDLQFASAELKEFWNNYEPPVGFSLTFL